MEDTTHNPEASEISPLLSQGRSKSAGSISVEQVIVNNKPWFKHYPLVVTLHLEKWKVIYICILFLFLVELGAVLMAPARLRMLEATICRRFYSRENPHLIGVDDNVPEKLCKVDPVQEELYFISGMKLSIDGIVSRVPRSPTLRDTK